MIRYVWIAALLAILCIVLYIPSAVPPDRFFEVLRAEHVVNRDVWGPAAADRILARMLELQQSATSLSEPPPPTVRVGDQPAVNAAMAQQVSQMSMRLFGNAYFRSIDALFALAAFRVSELVELISLVFVFCLVVITDGWVVRKVRAREFRAHSAETFSASVIAAIAAGSAVVVACFVPFQLNPMFFTLTLLGALFLLSRAIANYHAIG